MILEKNCFSGVACNNYEIVDLGVMVPRKIIAAAIEHEVDITEDYRMPSRLTKGVSR
jgi:cobalamin-dependent methionine synthase I